MRKMHKQNQILNKQQLSVRKDDADLRYATLDIAKSDIKGDAKWFLTRKDILAEQQKLRYQMQQQQMLQ